MQKRLIVEPIAEQLRIQFGNPQALELQLKTMLEQQQQQALQPNYMLVTCSTCWCICKAIYEAVTFELTVWQADLRQVNLAGVNATLIWPPLCLPTLSGICQSALTQMAACWQPAMWMVRFACGVVDGQQVLT